MSVEEIKLELLTWDQTHGTNLSDQVQDYVNYWREQALDGVITAQCYRKREEDFYLRLKHEKWDTSSIMLNQLALAVERNF